MAIPGFGVFGQDTTLDQQLKTAPDLSLEPWDSCCFASSGNKWALCPGPIPPPTLAAAHFVSAQSYDVCCCDPRSRSETGQSSGPSASEGQSSVRVGLLTAAVPVQGHREMCWEADLRVHACLSLQDSLSRRH